MGTRPRVATAGVQRSAKRKAATRRAPVKQLVVKQVAGAETETPVAERPLRPGQCRAHMRRVLAQEFREIVKGFVEGAKSGSCQHVKLATEFLEPRKRERATPSGRSTLKRLIHRMEQIDE